MKKIANQLLKGYLLNLGLIICLAVVLYLSYNHYMNSQLDEYELDVTQIMADYLRDNTSLEELKIGQNDFILVTDKNMNILDVKNKTLDEHKTLIDYQLETSDGGSHSYYVFETQDGRYLFHLFLGFYLEDIRIIYILVISALILFIVFAFLHARRTSQTIVTPIHKLVSGVQEMQKGNYNIHIDYETNTELDEIKNAIHQLNHSLAQETEHRQRLESERNELILSLSHDIKTPLTNIIGYAQSLSMKTLEPEIRQSIDTIYKYGLIATHLTDELFDFAKMDQNDLFITEQTDIVEATKVKLTDYIVEFDTLQIQYDFIFPEKQIYCQLHLMNYLRVLDNLIQNAIKYNQPPIKIKFQIIELDQHVQIIVEDDGIGIPLNYHSTIFDPMIRVENSRNRALGGTGLGLSIAKKIMIKHQGNITLDPNHQKGCRFILEIPKS